MHHISRYKAKSFKILANKIESGIDKFKISVFSILSYKNICHFYKEYFRELVKYLRFFHKKIRIFF